MAETTPKARTEVLPAVPAMLEGIPILSGGDDLIERTMDRLLNAATPEEMLADPDAYGIQDIAGQVITLTKIVGIAPSTIRGRDWYIVLEALVGTPGRIVTLTTGSEFATAAAVGLHRKGFLPRRVRIVQLESATAPGNFSLWFVDAPEGAELPRTAAENVAEANRRREAAPDATPTVPASEAGEAY